MTALEVTGVSKWFGDTVALSDVSFHSTPGVTGLLGHNGAGKSTLFDLLAGFSSPSLGSVRVLGVDPRQDPSVHERMGLVPDGDGLWPFLTAQQTVAFLARHRGVGDAAGALGAPTPVRTPARSHGRPTPNTHGDLSCAHSYACSP